MEVFFVDVGQGSCQIITLGRQRAIVIDAGGTGQIPLLLLQRLMINEIVLLAISHNDIDHRGGATRGRVRDPHYRPRGGVAAAGILGHYGKAISRIAVVDDGKLQNTVLGARINEMLKTRTLMDEQVQFLSIKDAPETWWESDDSTVALELLSPHGGTTLSARSSTPPNTNATSAVFLLSHHNTQILFTGDSQVSQWRTIDRLRKAAGHSKPFRVDVATVPHHGGEIGSLLDTNWYYANAVQNAVSIISVGSTNAYQHPKAEVVHKLRDAGHRIFCTQIGKGCADDVNSLRPGVSKTSQHFIGQASEKANRVTNGKRVACAGTIRLLLKSDGFAFDNDSQHQHGVDAIAKAVGCHPLCRH